MTLPNRGPQFLRNDLGLDVQRRGTYLNHVWRYGRTRHMSGSASKAIVPQCAPWPFTVDTNGVAYPAGLVGVQFDFDPYQPDPKTYNDARLVAVPATLPSGYTFRPNRDHNVGRSSTGPYKNCQGWALTSSDTTPGTVGSDFPHESWRTDIGGVVTPYNWFPENLGNLAFGDGSGGGALTTIGGLFIASPASYFSKPVTGVQYLQINWDNTFIGDSLRIELVCNADGSNSQPGDTVLWSYTGAAGVGTRDTGMVGPFNAPGTHQKAYMGFRLYDVTLATYAHSAMYLKMGPRLDIPFPWTCYGLDDSGNHIVAPGGV